MSAADTSRVGLGTAALAGLYDETDVTTARATVDRAWELGVRYFDTAPAYGSGLAEQRLGDALRHRPRDEFLISTKVGRLLRPGEPSPMFKGAPRLAPLVDFSADGVRRSLEESLERLGLDRVDIAYVHDPEGHLDAAIDALASLRDLVSELGVGTNSVATALAFARHGAIDHLLIAGRYTPLDDSAGHVLLDLCATRGIKVTAAGVFNSGMLCGGTTYDYQAAPQRQILRTRRLAKLCAGYDVPLSALALQFPLRNEAVTNILLGARSPDELEQDLELLSHDIPDGLWQEPLVPRTGAAAGAAVAPISER
jgi:D-threo-aldose 1-dehydrogenase